MMERYFTVAVFCCLLSIFLFGTNRVEATCYSQEDCLYDSLMTNYNKQVRPASGPGSGVNVDLDASLISILNLDEKNEVLDSVMKFSASWSDTYLTWNDTEYQIPEILIDVELLWVPDFATVNSVQQFYQSTFRKDFRAHITSGGLVIWEFGGVFHTSCSMDITRYPFDTQSCNIEMQNWAYKDVYVNITGGDFSIDDYSNNSLWELISTSVTRSDTDIDGSTFTLPKLTYTINIKRKTGYYLINLLLPICLLCIATLGVFWLPPDCGEKISLGITVLLAFSVFQIVIMDNTPVNSEETPIITTLVTFFLVTATISLIGSMLSVYLYFKKATSRVPRIIRIIAFKGLAKIFCLTNEIPDVKETTTVQPMENNVVHPETPLKDEKASLKTSFETSGPNSTMLSILHEVQSITHKIKEQEADDSLTDEWKLLAVIVDRCMFCIAFLACVVAVISLTV